MNGCSCPLAPNLILPVRLCQSAKWGGEAKQRDGGRGARVWKKSKRERERCCVKGLHKSEPKDLIANVRPETQSLFRWYPTVSNTHTCTHEWPIPALKLQTLSTQLCAAAVFAQQWEQELLLLIAESSMRLKPTLFRVEDSQLTDGDSVAHTGCGAQVLTCNYEPFIGHNVNYTAEEHKAHNAEPLNHNHLKENFCECLQETHVMHCSAGTGQK